MSVQSFTDARPTSHVMSVRRDRHDKPGHPAQIPCLRQSRDYWSRLLACIGEFLRHVEDSFGNSRFGVNRTSHRSSDHIPATSQALLVLTVRQAAIQCHSPPRDQTRWLNLCSNSASTPSECGRGRSARWIKAVFLVATSYPGNHSPSACRASQAQDVRRVYCGLQRVSYGIQCI